MFSRSKKVSSVLQFPRQQQWLWQKADSNLGSREGLTQLAAGAESEKALNDERQTSHKNSQFMIYLDTLGKINIVEYSKYY